MRKRSTARLGKGCLSTGRRIDEITITEQPAAALDGDMITAMEVHPEDAGCPFIPSAILAALQKRTVLHSALLDGEASAYRDAVLLNAAVALVVADRFLAQRWR